MVQELGGKKLSFEKRLVLKGGIKFSTRGIVISSKHGLYPIHYLFLIQHGRPNQLVLSAVPTTLQVYRNQIR